MADLLSEIFGLVSKRYRDMGDGSHAEVVAVGSIADQELTTITHAAVGIGTSSEAALAANEDRLYALLINDSDTTIYIALGATAVANAGIRLNANGGSYEMSKQGGTLYAGAINAIHGGSGDKTLLVTEGV